MKTTLFSLGLLLIVLMSILTISGLCYAPLLVRPLFFVACYGWGSLAFATLAETIRVNQHN